MEDNQTKPQTDRTTKVLRWVVGTVLAFILIAGAVVAWMYFSSPAAVRQPTSAHFHFRLQIIADGKAVNFAEDKYQTEFNKDICNADLTKQPFHFHDKLDQFMHVHWDHMTGGLLLKNYGWNLVGGTDQTLGYRFDQKGKIVRVPIHGLDLPAVAKGDKYYIYTGDQDHYDKRNWNDFIHNDLKDFFASKKTSVGLIGRLIPAAYAHGDEAEAEATQLNDVVGSAVIFVQKDAPTDAQIKDRFNHLVPLPMSACGG